MANSYASLVNRLEKAVEAIYELAERYALYKSHHAWKHAYEACRVWKKAVHIAIDTVESLEAEYEATDVVVTEEDVKRLSKILFHIRELHRLTDVILSERQAQLRERQ